MQKILKSILSKEGRYLSRSILLKEGVSPIIPKLIIITSSALFAGFLCWSVLTEIEEVAITTGSIVPIDSIIKVQHVDGGEVETVHVKEGDQVRMGDALITFNKQNITSLLHQVELQNKSLKLKLETFEEQIKIKQKLFKKGLNSRMSYLEAKIKHTDIKGKILENEEVIERYRKQLSRLTMFASVDGYIHNLTVESAGRVVTTGETIMEIVPLERRMRAELRISPDDIGHVNVDQNVTLKFNTYDYSQYGGKTAKLMDISPTTLTDFQGRPYYKGIVTFEGQNLDDETGLPIKPGMTIAGEIKTGKKTLFQYLIKPLIRSRDNAFRER